MYTCACGLEIPVANRSLHEIRCAGLRRRQLIPINDYLESPPLGVVPRLPLPVAIQSSGVGNGMWSCPNCTFSNSRSVCAMCGFRATGDASYSDILIPEVPLVQPLPRQAVNPAATSEWPCEACTLLNPSGVLRCDACGHQRSLEVTRPADSSDSPLISNLAAGALLGALSGAAIARMSGRPISSGLFNGAALGAIGGAALTSATSGYNRNPLIDDVDDMHRLHRQMVLSMLGRGVVPSPPGLGRGLDVDGMSYDELLAAFGPPEQHPARRNDIDSLPERIYEHAAGKKEECSICMEEFKGGECVKTLPCLHFYHSSCVNKWLEQSGNCPICKNEI